MQERCSSPLQYSAIKGKGSTAHARSNMSLRVREPFSKSLRVHGGMQGQIAQESINLNEHGDVLSNVLH
jgi:hypothetical protein